MGEWSREDCNVSDGPDKVFENILPTDFYLTNNPSDWRLQLMDEIRNIKQALNDKAIGKYSTLETYTGQTFFKSGDNNAERHLFRKVVDFGKLPQGGLPSAYTKSVAHGIDVTSTTYFTNIYGVANLNNSLFIPMPRYDIGDRYHIELRADTTNVTIQISSTSSSYYKDYTAYIVLEYLKY